MIKHPLTSLAVLTLIASSFIASGCNREGDSNQAKDTPAKTSDRTDSDTHSDAGPGHGGPVIELGTTTIGPFTVRASRDQGEVKAGGDAPIDVWLTGGDIATVTAVRFWIGTERGEDFVKARADIENPDEPNRWHTHAEVPSPLPDASKLWVEIEIDGQPPAKHVGSFDLNA